jgi:hypothetical protein
VIVLIGFCAAVSMAFFAAIAQSSASAGIADSAKTIDMAVRGRSTDMKYYSQDALWASYDYRIIGANPPENIVSGEK